MSSCLIRLDNFQGLYCAGNVIAGRVICTFDKTKSINGIKLELKGEERNAWTESESTYDSSTKSSESRSISYSGENTFLYVDVPLAGVGDVGPGTFEYPFTVQLPTNIPSTYKGHYGGICFTLNAKVQRSYNFNYTDTIQLTVVSLIDFNQIRDLLQLKVKSMVSFPLSNCKYDTEILAMQSDTGVGAHGERTYNFGLKIPETIQVPNFSISQLFSQRTMLKVTAVIPGVHSNLDVETDVTMGHVPIFTSQNQGQYPPNTYPPNLYPPTTYPTIRDGIRSPMSAVVPQEAATGSSATPTEGGVSIPFKEGIANNGFDMRGSAPPTYSEAVPNPEKQ